MLPKSVRSAHDHDATACKPSSADRLDFEIKGLVEVFASGRPGSK